jgi:hypothetical protein
VPVHRDAERGECDRWRGSEEAGEGLGAQNVNEHGERRYDDDPDDEAEEALGHFVFFQRLDSGPPVP